MSDRWHGARLVAKDLGRQIATARERRGVTQAQLAAIVGCDDPTMSRIESGCCIPGTVTAAKLDEWCLQASESDATPPVGVKGAARPDEGVNPNWSPGEWGSLTPPDQNWSAKRWSARWSDPTSSHDTVRSIAADKTLSDLIIQAAQELRVFDDGDLRWWLEAHGRYHDRNVVACARNRTDHGGLWFEIGLMESRTSGRRTKHFAVTETA